MTNPCGDVESGSLTKPEDNPKILFHLKTINELSNAGWGMTYLSNHTYLLSCFHRYCSQRPFFFLIYIYIVY